ncbi:MAG TPA: hypothetical protein VM240_07220 [Verrucomicrobiae bacterium]|nr:hypothetical protein [Verrucomicrobiae bacterium]
MHRSLFRFALGATLAAGVIPAAAQNATPSSNPKISLILVGGYADYSSRAPAEVSGVLLGPETDLAPAGLSVGETELVVDANVDDQFHGWATVALANEDGETVVELEEAYFNTLALPLGLAVKGGRFFSDIGYQNHVHAHGWDFVDLPLVYRALLAGQLNDDGVQMRWLAPTDLFMEFGAEILRGGQFPAGGERRSGANSLAAFWHLGGDVGASQSWRLGLSHLAADADDRRTGEAADTGFTGDSDVRILDVVWKWAPEGNVTRTSLVANAEFFWREEEGTLVSDPDGAAVASAYEGKQRGFYVQGAWQFMPRWRAGLRYDRLDAADNEIPNNPAGEFNGLLDDSYAPQRVAAMVDFSNSEFSRLRVQLARDETRPAGEADTQLFLQYILSLGSHPAHQF